MTSLNTDPDTSIPAPAPAYHDQETRFRTVFDLLNNAVTERAFPGAALAVTLNGQLIALRAFGRFTYELDAPQVEASSIFDLASVTKVVATTTMAMVLYERGVLDLDLPVISVIPEFRGDDPRRDAVTLRMLLAHSSGLPAYERLFLIARNREELLSAAYCMPLAADPGTRAAYSDIGFILLGVALERLADETLDRFCHREIFGPLGMAETTFNPPKNLIIRMVPTADDQSFRHRVIQGEVQDENASVLGGVAGHAGLFSTAADIAIFANAILRPESEPVRPDTLAIFTQRQKSPSGTSRALGWDTPSMPSQSGQYFSPRSFGHLGYTGTSVWIDPDRRLSITLLTNRTWPDCQNQAIKKVRPAVHDAIMKAIA